MERSRGEIIQFAAAILGIWLAVWGVILVNKWLFGTAVVIILGALLGFALRDND
jgi:hypothetical protein